MPDLLIGQTIRFGRNDPTSLDLHTFRVTVRNDGPQSTPSGVVVQAAVDGVEIATQEIAVLTSGDEVDVTFVDVGPVEAGFREFTVTADPGNVIEEANEENNQVAAEVLVLRQDELPLATSTQIAGATDSETLYRVEIPGNAPMEAALRVELSGGSGDPDLYVTGGERPSDYTRYDCASANPASEERCVINLPETERPRFYHVNVVGYDAYSDVTLRATIGEPEGFDIEVVYRETPTILQEDIVTAAAERWESVLVGDLPDYFWSDQDNPNCRDVRNPAPGDRIDDVQIQVEFLDGGQYIYTTELCWVRGTAAGRHYFTPIVVAVGIDLDYIFAIWPEATKDDVIGLVMTAMGSVLGKNDFAYLRKDLLGNPSQERLNGSPGADSHFRGPKAIEAFDDAGGASYAGPKVPLQNDGAFGSDAYWRGSVFGDELMTEGFRIGAPNPLSAITVQSFADYGYEVDVMAADPYKLPSPSADRAPGTVIDLRRHTRVVTDGAAVPESKLDAGRKGRR